MTQSKRPNIVFIVLDTHRRDRMTHYVEQIGSGRLIATQRHTAIA